MVDWVAPLRVIRHKNNVATFSGKILIIRQGGVGIYNYPERLLIQRVHESAPVGRRLGIGDAYVWQLEVCLTEAHRSGLRAYACNCVEICHRLPKPDHLMPQRAGRVERRIGRQLGRWRM